MSQNSKPDTYKKLLGAWGEQQAEVYLINHGLIIIDKNFRTRAGEVDIIAREEDELIFVEVKTRTNSEFGFPEEAVTETKLEHLIEAAEAYLEKQAVLPPWRVDVLAVIGTPNSKTVQIEWFKNVG
jgi:putative endonuclease